MYPISWTEKYKNVPEKEYDTIFITLKADDVSIIAL